MHSKHPLPDSSSSFSSKQFCSPSPHPLLKCPPPATPLLPDSCPIPVNSSWFLLLPQLLLFLTFLPHLPILSPTLPLPLPPPPPHPCYIISNINKHPKCGAGRPRLVLVHSVCRLLFNFVTNGELYEIYMCILMLYLYRDDVGYKLFSRYKFLFLILSKLAKPEKPTPLVTCFMSMTVILCPTLFLCQL